MGGTNTDAVLLEDDAVAAGVKTPTTPDVTTGITRALAELGIARANLAAAGLLRNPIASAPAIAPAPLAAFAGSQPSPFAPGSCCAAAGCSCAPLARVRRARSEECVRR